MNNGERVAHWQRVMTEWKDSGLSGMAFCKQHDHPYPQFTYWRKKLRTEESDQPTPPAGFARVTAAEPIGEPASELTVTLPGGVSITGLHAGNVDLLGAIVRQL